MMINGNEMGWMDAEMVAEPSPYKWKRKTFRELKSEILSALQIETADEVEDRRTTEERKMWELKYFHFRVSFSLAP